MDDKLTHRQVKVLCLIAPYPMGSGLTYSQVAEQLGVSYRAIEQIVRTIKNKHSKAYKALKVARHKAAETKLQLQKIEQLTFYDESKIRQQF